MITRYIALFTCTFAFAFCICCVDIARREAAPKWSVWLLVMITGFLGATWLWQIYFCAKEVPLL